MENLIIRKAIPDDAEKILEYLNQIGGESENLLFGLNEFDMPVEREKAFIESINNSINSVMLLGINDDTIISIASLQGFGKKRISHRGNFAISVKQMYWHHGIATKMIAAIISFAQGSGITVIELEVKTDNINAITLYEKMGFIKIGTYKNKKYYDAYLMNLYLS